MFTATDTGGGLVTITGILQYRDSSGDFQPLNSSMVTFYWWSTASGNALSNYVGEVYSNDKNSQQPGGFTYYWSDGLEPGNYFVKGVYTANGASWSGYAFQDCTNDTPLKIRLNLQISLNNPTISLAQGDSTTLTVTVGALNSKNPHSATLSTAYSPQLFRSVSFTPNPGNTPFASTLSLNVFNVTQPGTYSMIVTATSNEDSSVSASTPLIMNVQQNTHMITINVEGLPSDILTPLSVNGTFIENIGTGSVTLAISDYAEWISVSQMLPLKPADTLYQCQNFNESVDMSVTTLTFTYNVQYKLQLLADLPPTIPPLPWLLKVNSTLEVIHSNSAPSKFPVPNGFSDFYPKDATIQFGLLNSSDITTKELDYKFTGWTDPTNGQVMKNANDGLLHIVLSKPMILEASFDRVVKVTFKVNLPSGFSTQLQMGVAGGDTKNITMASSYVTGEYPLGSAFQYDVSQNKLLIFNANGDTRYEFEGFNPTSPITLTQHTTVVVNYSLKYRVRALSKFPGTILQPVGGIAWLAPGQIATIQAKPDVSDDYGLPYLFDRWTGTVTSNVTRLSFPVTRPVDVTVQWKINLTYLLAIIGGAAGLLAPSVLVIRKRIINYSLKKVRKKSIPPIQPNQALKQGLSDDDMKIYNYIVAHDGMLKYSECIKDLGYERKQIERCIANLKASRMLS